MQGIWGRGCHVNFRALAPPAEPGKEGLMSKVTDALDSAAGKKRENRAAYAVASSDADEKRAWASALESGETLDSLIEAKGPPRLYLHEDQETPQCSIHYRGYRCWISGAHGAKEALEVLEEFSLSDLSPDVRWHTVQAAIDLALELRSPGAPELSLEERADRVEQQAMAATIRHHVETPLEGAAAVGVATAAVWCADPHVAIVIDRGGTPAFAAWSMRPVDDIVRWIDEGETLSNAAILP